MSYRKVYVKGRGKVYEHRLVMETKLGRRLVRGEVVHHVNGDKRDNRPENLELMSSATHSLLHNPQRLPSRKRCKECGAIFTPHKAARGKQQTCSRKCGYAWGARKRPKHLKGDEVRRMLKAGWTYKKITAAIGVSGATVSRIANNS
ncbi:MAG: HNH endonuclease [Phycisphaerales bacterium]|nr:HNH endonuclease [Phycisphaerales bacterium]